jgi:uncharacterized protein YegL
MKKGKTEIVFIIDRSGSMEGSEKDTIGGFNSFINEQKKLDGEARVTAVLFDNQYEVLIDNKDLNEVNVLTNEEYFVRGSTALVDAMCKAIDYIGKKLSDLPEEERPEKVIFVTITDGAENASKEFTNKQLKERIKHQTDKYKWEFIFLSSDISQFATAKYDWGIDKTFSYTKDNTTFSYSAMNNAVACFRNTGHVDVKDLNDSKMNTK